MRPLRPRTRTRTRPADLEDLEDLGERRPLALAERPAPLEARDPRRDAWAERRTLCLEARRVVGLARAISPMVRPIPHRRTRATRIH